MPLETRQAVAALTLPPGTRWRPNAPVAQNDYIGMGEAYRRHWFSPGYLQISETAATITQARYCEILRGVIAWAEQHDILIKLYDFAYGSEEWNNELLWSWAVIPQQSANSPQSFTHTYGTSSCRNGHTWKGGWICPNCAETLACTSCGSIRGTTWIAAEGQYACRDCFRRCSWVTNPLDANSRCENRFLLTKNYRFAYCEEHGDRKKCDGCETITEVNGRFKALGGQEHCKRCREKFCEICDTLKSARIPYYNTAEAFVCDACVVANPEINPRTANEKEVFDEAAILAPDKFKLESTKVRPIRMCSIELETVDGGALLAKALHEAGLSPHDKLMQYHSSKNAFCHVERDNSLGETGGELIFNRILLDNEEDVEKLYRGVETVRSLVKAGTLNMDTRCGLHIHVDAHNMGIGHVRNLVLVHNYLEDVLYRLSAAHYTRHRGQEYAVKTEKGEKYYKDIVAFGLNFFNTSGHHHGLNVGNYWQAINNYCKCGSASLFKDAVKCQCNLGKCTFEFRVYNGTTNFRKIHAYAALSQSMVAYARAMPDLQEGDYPSLEYKAFHKNKDGIKAERDTRLRWMFSKLYFTEAERDSLLYVIKNSSIADCTNLESLAAIPYSGPSTVDYEITHRNLRKEGEDDTSTVAVDPFGPLGDVVYDDEYYDDGDF